MSTVQHFRDVEVAEIACNSLLNRVHGMPFAWSINPYQGCYHQCVFCYARATHRYRELDGVAAWGTRLTAKVNAAAVLRRELLRPGWTNEHVAIGTATDPYQAIEGRYRITRGVLAELARAATPAHLITRSPLIVRDLDVLTDLARAAEFSVCISLPTLDAALAHRIEPTVAPPAQRLRAVRRLAEAGIRVGVAIAPVLPHLTDDRATIAGVVRAAADAGASFAWHGVLNLGDVAREAFFAYLSAEQAHLVQPYAALYRAKYPPAAYVRRVDERAAAARSGVVFAPPQRIAPRPPPQLVLFDQPR
jgi:DNA repair photolyase